MPSRAGRQRRKRLDDGDFGEIRLLTYLYMKASKETDMDTHGIVCERKQAFYIRIQRSSKLQTQPLRLS